MGTNRGAEVNVATPLRLPRPTRFSVWHTGCLSPPRMRSSRSRGFTLVELMIVVAIVGVLAALAIVGYREYLLAGQTGEAKMVIQGIRGAQEVHKAETLTYLSCSASYIDFYPQGVTGPNDKKWHFRTSPPNPCWEQLNVSTDGPVRFAYAVVAGAPGTTPPPMSGQWTTPPVWPAASPSAWYVVQATGDRDIDGRYSLFVASSFSGEVYAENDTE